MFDIVGKVVFELDLVVPGAVVKIAGVVVIVLMISIVALGVMIIGLLLPLLFGVLLRYWLVLLLLLFRL